MGTLDFPEKFVACDLKAGRYSQFTVFKIMGVLEVKFTFNLEVKFTFNLDQHDLSQRLFIKDQISGERYQDHWSSG